MKYITPIIMVIVLTLLGILVVQLVMYRSGPNQVAESAIRRPYARCLVDGQTCTSDVDCLLCTDKGSFEFLCQESTKGGKRYCLPRKPRQPCNAKLGGVWSWTGWGDTSQQGWACTCTYPEISGNMGCTKVNPNVCSGGNYTFDSTKTTSRGPRPTDCICPENSVLVADKVQVPLCIPRDKGLCSTTKGCERTYDSSHRNTAQP